MCIFLNLRKEGPHFHPFINCLVSLCQIHKILKSLSNVSKFRQVKTQLSSPHEEMVKNVKKLDFRAPSNFWSPERVKGTHNKFLCYE